MSEGKSSEAQANDGDIRALLEEFQPILDSVTRASIRGVGIFGCALRASLSKSLEFTALAHRDPPPEKGFFITSTLRGICEDLIVLTFVGGLSSDDRNEALSHLMARNIADGIAAQSVFFSAMRPWQPVLQPPKQAVTDTDNRLRELSSKLGWAGKQAWPTVWFMAKASSLAPLYSYIYAATSKWVHFSPHILLRMGWGGQSGDVSDETEWTFTTTNFSQYYVDFNQIYALMLFLRFVRGPAATILPTNAEPICAALQACLDKPLRWPEDVTFEEMNLKGPGSLQRILLRAAHETGSLGPS